MSHVEIGQAKDITHSNIAGRDIKQWIHNIVFPDRDERRMRRARRDALRNIRVVRIDGFLSGALGQGTCIELDMEYRSDLVQRSWSKLRGPREGDRSRPDKHLAGVFEESGRALLILGEPGSGKTVTLLSLLRTLLIDAESEPERPLPLFLDLSTWAVSRPPFREWLVAELNELYQISRKNSLPWIEGEEVCLLLDGLDDIQDAASRAACVAAINEFRRHYAVQIAVSCRTEDYRILDQRFTFPEAIVLQPLRDGQIDEYLARFGEEVSGTLQADPELKELARRPLFLSALVRTDQHLDKDHLFELTSLADRRRYILQCFAEGRIDTQPWDRDYTPDQAKAWLTWLADQMQRHGKKIFVSDQMQPSWLPDSLYLTRYALYSRVSIALIAGLGTLWSITPIFFWLSAGLALGLLDASKLKQNLQGDAEKKSILKRSRLGNMLRVGGTTLASTGCLLSLVLTLLAPLTAWLLFKMGLVTLADVELSDPWQTAGFGCGFLFGQSFVGFVVGVIAGALYSLPLMATLGRANPNRRPQSEVEVVESLSWSSASSVRGMIMGLPVGLVLALLALLPIGLIVYYLVDAGILFQETLQEYSRRFMIINFGVYISISALIGGLIGGVRGRTSVLGAGDFDSPSVISKVNANLGGLVVGSLGGILAGFGFGVTQAALSWITLSQYLEPRFATVYSLIVGAASGLFYATVFMMTLAPVAWLIYGGANLLKAKILRYLLHRSGTIPQGFEQYLDHMAEIALLRRVGCGYAFIHDQFRDVFSARPASGWSGESSP